jgi:RPA family protein
MDILGITDYRIFSKRLEDAKFSYDQLRNLKDKGLL